MIAYLNKVITFAESFKEMLLVLQLIKLLKTKKKTQQLRIVRFSKKLEVLYLRLDDFR